MENPGKTQFKALKNLNVKTIINMSNIDYVYDKDPKKNKDAKKIKNIFWRRYRKISGNKWEAGLNKPFDPIAASPVGAGF